MSLLEDIHAGISEAELDARLTEALRRHEITEATAAPRAASTAHWPNGANARNCCGSCTRPPQI